MQDAQVGIPSPIEDNSFDVAVRLCDDKGMVSHQPINEEVDTLDESYLGRHTRLAGPTSLMGDKRKGWPFTEGEGWQCTGHAHYKGLHIQCSNPIHNQVLTGAGTRPEFLYDPNIHRCSECFKELYEADRGYGSTALACEIHGFDRQIVTVPKWIEDSVRWHPSMALRYVGFVIDNLDP